MRFLACAALLALGLSSCKKEGVTIPPDPQGYVLAEKGHLFPSGTKLGLSMTITNEDTVHTDGSKESKSAGSEYHEDRLYEYLKEGLIRVVPQKTTFRLLEEPKLHDIPNPWFKEPVLLQRKDVKWEGKLESGNAPSKEERNQIAALAHDVGRDFDFLAYGGEKRKVGDTWRITDPLAFFNEPASNVSGIMEVTLKAIEELDGKQYARLEGWTKFSGDPSSVSDQAARVHATYDLKFVALRSLEHNLNVETTYTGTSEMIATDQSGKTSKKSRRVKMEIRSVIQKQ